jgi:hypothetical protein
MAGRTLLGRGYSATIGRRLITAGTRSWARPSVRLSSLVPLSWATALEARATVARRAFLP